MWPAQRSPFRCLTTSPEVIRLAVVPCIRVPPSWRNVEDLHERGIEVSHEAARFGWHRLGPMFAAEIRPRRAQGLRSVSRWRWHLDEMFVPINGVQHYLWRENREVTGPWLTIGPRARISRSDDAKGAMLRVRRMHGVWTSG